MLHLGEVNPGQYYSIFIRVRGVERARGQDGSGAVVIRGVGYTVTVKRDHTVHVGPTRPVLPGPIVHKEGEIIGGRADVTAIHVDVVPILGLRIVLPGDLHPLLELSVAGPDVGGGQKRPPARIRHGRRETHGVATKGTHGIERHYGVSVSGAATGKSTVVGS